MSENQIVTVGSLKAQVLDPLALVSYQAGSIVSREVLREGAGTVTLFAFDDGQGLSEHTAPFDALLSILEGIAIVSISGATHQLQAGQMIIMPANEPHSLQAVGKFKMMLTMIRTRQ